MSERFILNAEIEAYRLVHKTQFSNDPDELKHAVDYVLSLADRIRAARHETKGAG